MKTRLRLSKFLQPGEAYHFGQTELTPARPDRFHNHDFIEVFWVEKGQGWHWINGERRLLVPGQLVFIRAPDVHGFSSANGSVCSIANAAFTCATWNHLRRRYFSDSPDPFKRSPIAHREHLLSAAELEALRAESPALAQRPWLRVRIERFLINLMYGRLTDPRKTEQDVPEWLATACRRIKEPKQFAGGTPAFAALSHRSPEHVAREVRRHLDKTPTDLVNQARLAHAAAQLGCGSRKILEISMECGFENLGHFYGLFARRYGMTPRQYRLRQQRIVLP